MDVQNAITPTEKDLQAAFNAENVAQFTALIKQCGEEKLWLIESFTQKSVSAALKAETGFFGRGRKGKYEDMMIAGLKRLVDFSTPGSGLRVRLWLDPIYFRKCFDVINGLSREKIRDIMLYRNPEGYSFRYLHPEVLCMPGEERTRPHKEIDAVRLELRRKYFTESNAKSCPQDLQQIAKSGFVSCRELFEHLLKFLPPEKIEDIFKDIYFRVYSVSGTLAEVSLPLFKFLINSKKVVIECFFSVFVWLMDKNSLVDKDKIKFLTMKYGCIAFFQSQWRERTEKVDAQGEKIMRVLVENKFVDFRQLQDLYTYLRDEQKELVKCQAYLGGVLKQFRHAATTLLGIFMFKRSPILNILRRDEVDVIARMIVGQRTALDVQPKELPDVPRPTP